MSNPFADELDTLTRGDLNARRVRLVRESVKAMLARTKNAPSAFDWNVLDHDLREIYTRFDNAVSLRTFTAKPAMT